MIENFQYIYNSIIINLKFLVPKKKKNNYFLKEKKI